MLIHKVMVFFPYQSVNFYLRTIIIAYFRNEKKKHWLTKFKNKCWFLCMLTQSLIFSIFSYKIQPQFYVIIKYI